MDKGTQDIGIVGWTRMICSVRRTWWRCHVVLVRCPSIALGQVKTYWVCLYQCHLLLEWHSSRTLSFIDCSRCRSAHQTLFFFLEVSSVFFPLRLTALQTSEPHICVIMNVLSTTLERLWLFSPSITHPLLIQRHYWRSAIHTATTRSTLSMAFIHSTLWNRMKLQTAAGQHSG